MLNKNFFFIFSIFKIIHTYNNNIYYNSNFNNINNFQNSNNIYAPSPYQSNIYNQFPEENFLEKKNNMIFKKQFNVLDPNYYQTITEYTNLNEKLEKKKSDLNKNKYIDRKIKKKNNFDELSRLVKKIDKSKHIYDNEKYHIIDLPKIEVFPEREEKPKCGKNCQELKKNKFEKEKFILNKNLKELKKNLDEKKHKEIFVIDLPKIEVLPEREEKPKCGENCNKINIFENQKLFLNNELEKLRKKFEQKKKIEKQYKKNFIIDLPKIEVLPEEEEKPKCSNCFDKNIIETKNEIISPFLDKEKERNLKNEFFGRNDEEDKEDKVKDGLNNNYNTYLEKNDDYVYFIPDYYLK